MRSLAIGLLSLSLVGGFWLGTDRQSQQHNAALEDAQRYTIDDMYQQISLCYLFQSSTEGGYQRCW